MAQEPAGVEFPQTPGLEAKNMPTSFATHIRPLFRDIDVQHMKGPKRAIRDRFEGDLVSLLVSFTQPDRVVACEDAEGFCLHYSLS
jgi:hypothetical protein